MKEVKFIRKSDSKLHRLIARLPFVPKSYMARYWTTIGQTIAVPEKDAPSAGVFDMPWEIRHRLIIAHEKRHAMRARKLTLPLYATLYLGPSITLGPIALALSPLLGGLTAFLWTLGVVAALLPLSVGFAVFRTWDECDAYLEAIRLNPDRMIDLVADGLWEDYLAMPPPITRWWIRRIL